MLMHEHHIYRSQPHTFEAYAENAQLARTRLIEFLVYCKITPALIRQILQLVDDEEQWIALIDQEANVESA